MKAEDEDITNTATTIPEDDKIPPGEEVSSPAEDIPSKVPPENKEEMDNEPIKPEEEKPKPFSKMCHFRKFTEKTYEELVIREKSEKLKAQERLKKGQTARLVDGDLRFGDDDEDEQHVEPDPLLHEGNTLTENYGVFPTPYCGWPIEEIDQGIKDKTFVVISRRVTKKTIYRFSATRSFYIFSPWSPIRKMAVLISTNQFFDYLVILTIITNCVFLALPTMTFTETSEYVFLGIYTLEMFIKLIARGFFINKYTYLRDPWNWLDFIVIVIAYVTTIIQAAAPGFSVGNLTSLRTFRVFRALKTVSIIPGLKTIVGALLRAFKMLIEVIMLTVFCLMVFALFALQVYMGGLRQKCVLNFNLTQSDSIYVTHYTEHIRNSSNWLADGDGGYMLCGNITGSGQCPANYTCLPDIGENPNSGYTNFDHFGWAMLNAFQLITLDFWEDTYNKVIRASGPWNLVFFILVVFFGSFYLINLMLAVVAMSYEEEAVRAGKEKEREKASQRKKMNQNPIYDLTKITIASRKMKGDDKKKKDKKAELKKNDTQGTEGLKQPQKKPRPPVNPKKPMVKIPSKDSGYSSRSQNSSRSVGSRVLKHRDSRERLKNPEDAETDSEASSSINYAFKGTLIKQNSRGNGFLKVSSSGVIFERESTVSELNSLEENKETSVVIIRADEDPDVVPGPNELVDRNCICCRSCCKCFIPLLRTEGMVYAFISDPLFDLFITLSIILNTIIMALEQHGQSEQMNVLIKVANYVFTAIFILEAVLKLYALNKYYFKSGWNIFDLIIVIASIIDLGFEEVDGLSVFRTFRLLRVFKLAQSWPTMRILLSIILSTLGALGNLTIVLAIIIYIFAVTGLQLFMSTYTPEKFAPDPPPRWNFNNIQHALMMIFRVLCGEWIEPLWACMKANNELCMVVFLPALVLGYFIVLNLFLALLLNAFATDSIRKHKETNQEESRLKLAWQRIKGLCCCCLGKNINSIEPKKNGKASEEESTNVIDIDENGKEVKNADADADAKPSTNGVNTKSEDSKKTQSNGSVKGKNVKEAQAAFDTTQKRAQFSSFEEARLAEAARKKNGEDEDGLALGDTASSLKKNNEVVVHNCMPKILAKRMPWLSKYDKPSRWYSMRRFLVKVADNKVFETAVLLTIFASSVTLAFEDVTLDEKPSLKLALYYLNIIFCILFSIEMLIKMFGYGLHKYFTSFWTILDFCIVLISIISLIAESLGISNIAAFRSLRTLRAIRPLRAISRWQGMKIVVNALMLAIPAIVNVILVCLVFWLIFSIMGVQFFSGKFYKCVDANLERIDADIIANRSQCEANSHLNYSWRNSHVNFDNVLQGYLALFQVATFEGWMEVMIDAVDATDIDLQPKNENNFAAYLYFVGFIIFGAFFTLNLLIGVIIDNFNVLKKRYEGSYLDMFLTSSQRNYYNTLKKLGNKKPQKTIKRPKKQFAAFFYDVSISNKFELSIVLIIFLNMIVMGIEHYNQSDAVSQVLDIMNIIFTTVFTLEAMVKLIGLRWHYFRQAWNVFDFIIVILSILDITVSQLQSGVVLDDLLSDVFVTPTLLRVVRIFRIGRVLRLIKAAKGIRKLLFALIISLPAIFNIGALLFLILYIYAIIGLSSFGNLKINGALDDIVNFRTFFNSFMLLLRLATSAGWNDILDAMLISPPDCDPDHKTLPNGTLVKETYGDCGIPWLAIPFMVTYIIIIFLVVINMYIAVILENFNQAHEQEEVGITEDDFDMFYVVWERYDPHATQFIKYEQLTDFVADLEEPFGIAKPNEIALVSFDLPIVEGDKLHCLDILMALVKNVLSDVEETAEFREARNQMELKFQAVFPSRVNTVVKSTTMQRKKEEVAAKTLQQAWKSFKTQRLLKNITVQAMQQNLSRSSSQDSRSRANSIMSLGRRLSNALTSFFSSSRPSSAVSRASLKSAQNQHFSPIRKKNVSNTLQVPSVNTLYSSSSDLDINHLDL
ncbi:sodium channel protein 1 brain-like [Haliotis rubra]|uniref:sodium channel protein 1 brain-like n=1 Tax=Haliotis rubra TaxID=36100 RepID=UPI001EE61085|nr:sodium channel protein 1 brain-like [Haliotis rubra]